MISAVRSGSGKTTVTAGVLMALKKRGINIRAFKSGPDFIDPAFHSRVLKVPSKNLDPFFSDDETLRYLYGRGADDEGIAVIEGAMGYYDGISFEGDEGSSHSLAVSLSCPVVIVLDARGFAYTGAAVLKGLCSMRENSMIRGVIFNNITEKTYLKLSKAVEKETGLTPLGFLPGIKEISIDSRHLGLLLPDEVEDLDRKLSRLCEEVEKHIDIEGLVKLSREAEELTYKEPEKLKISEAPTGKKIAVTADKALSFTYEDNLELIRSLGFEIEFFSPLEDKEIPKDASGLILLGGYPEVYGRELSENKEMMESIRNALKSGLPCIAECGGFMYLQDSLTGTDGKEYPMAGVFSGSRAERMGRLINFGYVTLTPDKENPLLHPGESIRGHEFHTYSCTDNGDIFNEVKPSDIERKNAWKGIRREYNTFGGFPHLYYPSNPLFIKRFLSLCR